MNRLKSGLAHPSLFDEGVEAARNACVAGASIAAAAIVASAYCDSPLVGTPALRRCMQLLATLPLDIDDWIAAFSGSKHPQTNELAFAPGFGYLEGTQGEFIRRLLRRLFRLQQRVGTGERCGFCMTHHAQLAAHCGPLNRVGLMALVSLDQGYTIEHAERQFLAWNIERAIFAAQRASQLGVARFPFLSDIHTYEGEWPSIAASSLENDLRLIGLEQ